MDDKEKSRYEHPKFSAQEVLGIWIAVETAYREEDFDRFVRNLGVAVEQAVIYKHDEVLGSKPPHVKGGMHNLREKGLINESQSNLNWLWDLRNEYANRGFDLHHNDAERAIKIGRTIITGCFQKFMQFGAAPTKPSQDAVLVQDEKSTQELEQEPLDSIQFTQEENLQSISETEVIQTKVSEKIDEIIPAIEDFVPEKKIREIKFKPGETIEATSVIPEELFEEEMEDEQIESEETIKETSIIPEKLFEEDIKNDPPESEETIQETTIVPEEIFEEETEEEKLISLEIIEITDVITDDFFTEEEKEQEQIKPLESQPEEEIETSSTTSFDSTQEDDFIKEFEKKTYRFCPECGYKNLRTDDLCVNCWIRFE